jgi:hypothetical protein
MTKNIPDQEPVRKPADNAWKSIGEIAAALAAKAAKK